MKKRSGFIAAFAIAVLWATAVRAQQIDTDRMSRDIEIAENALSTIIKQQFDKRSMWVEVKATYTPGFGVTMRLPNDNSGWIYSSSGQRISVIAPTPAGASSPGSTSVGGVVIASDDDQNIKGRIKMTDAARDSARAAYYTKMIKASKDFITDYGDLLSQLAPDEKILITNRGDGRFNNYYYDLNKPAKRQLVTIEATRSDITQFRQGKISRDQMISKIRVVNTESSNEVEADLELLSSIMSRLYRSDLSKTYYTDQNIWYERLKNFGVIYYMDVYSGVEMDRTPGEASKGRMWRMPTQRLEGLNQEQRDKKVTELFPQFEKDLKESIVEYAQTVKSLKDEEMFVFSVQITKCAGCGIPSTLELSIKNANVRKVAAGQMSKADAVASISVKKGPAQ